MENARGANENLVGHGNQHSITDDLPSKTRKILGHLELNERVVQQSTGIVIKKLSRLFVD